MAFILANDALSGKEGTAFGTINGSVRELPEIRSITASFEKTKAAFKCLGFRGTQHKATGWSGSGSVTFYYITSEWARLLTSYARTGVDTYFDIVLTNEDPGSRAGRQRIRLGRCNLNNADIAKLDVDAEWLDATFAFTFEEVELLEGFDYQFQQ